MGKKSLADYAKYLDQAVADRQEVPRLTMEFPELSMNAGYEIQALGRDLRLARGEKIVGYKMGLTSRAKMQQMGVEAPIAGFLSDRFAVRDGGTLTASRLIHPKVEPEIAFRMRSKLSGRSTRAEFLAACDSVLPALEVIDSRYLNFDFRLPDVVADNCSAAGFIVGKGRPVAELENLPDLPIELVINGEVVQKGWGRDILGDPVDSALELMVWLDAQGLELPAGSIVLAGGATAAVSIQPKDRVECRISGLGEASFVLEA